MFLNIQIPMYTVRDYISVKLENKGDLTEFPILTIGKDSYINASQMQSGLDCYPAKMVHNVQIGKYCSLATGITFMVDLNHDYLSVSTSYISEFKGRKESVGEPVFPGKLKRKGEIIIQNDCWVGHGVTIMAGTTIHNGAVVAAGSVVRGDVPPYAIVAGNPASVVKYRFSQDIIDALQKIAWWNWDSQKLADNYECMQGDVEKFVKEHLSEAEKRIEQEKQRVNPVNRLCDAEVFCFRADLGAKFPVYPRVIQEFCSKYHNKDAQLVIYIPTQCGDKEKALDIILNELYPWKDNDCVIQIIDEETIVMDDIIRNADIYITNREFDNIQNTCVADLYNKKIISGIDAPIFGKS